jgi:hypothetical protein
MLSFIARPRICRFNARSIAGWFPDEPIFAPYVAGIDFGVLLFESGYNPIMQKGSDFGTWTTSGAADENLLRH